MPASSGSALALAARLRALDDDALARLVTVRGVRDQRHPRLLRSGRGAARPRLGAVGAATARPPGAGAARGRRRARRDHGDCRRPRNCRRSARRRPRSPSGSQLVADLGLVDGTEDGRSSPGMPSSSSCAPGRRSACPRSTELLSARRRPRSSRSANPTPRFVDRGAGDRAFAHRHRGDRAGARAARRAGPPARPRRSRPARRPPSRAATGIESDRARRRCSTSPRRAGLAALEGGDLDRERLGRRERWLRRPAPQRWAALAERLARAPARRAARTAARTRARRVGRRAARLPAVAVPGGRRLDAIRERSTSVAREAELLGHHRRSTPPTPRARAARHGGRRGSRRDRRPLPARGRAGLRAARPVDHRAGAAGRPRSIIRLRGFADVEARGLASSYRVTGASLDRALIAGETAEGIRAVPRRRSRSPASRSRSTTCSSDTAARFGSLRVGPIDDTAAHRAGGGMRAATCAATTTALLAPARGRPEPRPARARAGRRPPASRQPLRPGGRLLDARRRALPGRRRGRRRAASCRCAASAADRSCASRRRTRRARSSRGFARRPSARRRGDRAGLAGAATRARRSRTRWR